MSDKDLVVKLEELCKYAGAPTLAKEVQRARSALEEGDMGALLKLLNSPMPIRQAAPAGV
jgi:uncharacterized protein HemY